MSDLVYNIGGGSGSSSTSSSGGGVSAVADYIAPFDFTAIRQTNSTLRLSGLPAHLTVTSLGIVYIKVLDSHGVVNIYFNGIDDNFVWDADHSDIMASSIIFNTNESYEVGINGQDPVIRSIGSAPITLQAEYASPYDFTVAYTSNVTLTVSNAPFTVEEASCTIIGIMVLSSTNVWTKFINGANGVSITAAANVITIAGAGTPFAATDLAYRVTISAQRKAYDPSTDSIKIIEQAPERANYIQDSIEAVDVANATTYDFSMDGYRDLSLTGYLIDGAEETTSFTVSASNDEDTTDANAFNIIYGYDSVANAMVNAVSTTAATTKFALDFDNLNYSTIRITITATAATNTINIKVRRKS